MRLQAFTKRVDTLRSQLHITQTKVAVFFYDGNLDEQQVKRLVKEAEEKNRVRYPVLLPKKRTLEEACARHG